MRFGAQSLKLAPSLAGRLSGVVLHDLAWHGRRFTITIRRGPTTIALDSGAPLPISTPAGRRLVRTNRPLTLATARPDLARTGDLVRCGSASASSSQPGAPALAAVDGSRATDWAPVSLPATLTAPVRGPRVVGKVVVTWGRQWPAAPKPNVKPPPAPVKIRRPGRYSLSVSADGRHWRTVARIAGRAGTTDTLAFPPRRARYVRLRITSPGGSGAPLLEELSVTG
ncbi:MAG: discoidin domain-containing protein [Actinomycetota bacterium]|nr:discoidin domain-containing protein [Actinomycetota bacterium]